MTRGTRRAAHRLLQRYCFGFHQIFRSVTSLCSLTCQFSHCFIKNPLKMNTHNKTQRRWRRSRRDDRFRLAPSAGLFSVCSPIFPAQASVLTHRRCSSIQPMFLIPVMEAESAILPQRLKNSYFSSSSLCHLPPDWLTSSLLSRSRNMPSICVLSASFICSPLPDLSGRRNICCGFVLSSQFDCVTRAVGDGCRLQLQNSCWDGCSVFSLNASNHRPEDGERERETGNVNRCKRSVVQFVKVCVDSAGRREEEMELLSAS